jgi:hypothetical protein
MNWQMKILAGNIFSVVAVTNSRVKMDGGYVNYCVEFEDFFEKRIEVVNG